MSEQLFQTYIDDSKVKNVSQCVVSVRVPFMALCPIPNRVHGEPEKPYGGTLSVIYMPRDRLLEWDSFAQWVRCLSETKLSAEQALAYISEEFIRVCDPVAVLSKLEIDSPHHLPIQVSRMYVDSKSMSTDSWIKMLRTVI